MTEAPIVVDPTQVTLIITVEGTDYALNCSEFTPREVGQLKQFGHIRGVMDIPDAIRAMDLEAIAALAVIAMQRAGRIINPDALLDSKMGAIVLNIPATVIEPRPTSAT